MRRTVAEKRRIVELILEPGANVATVARAEDVNANQAFEWRRAYSAGRLNNDGSEQGSALLPVVVSHGDEARATLTLTLVQITGHARLSQSAPISAGGLRRIKRDIYLPQDVF